MKSRKIKKNLVHRHVKAEKLVLLCKAIGRFQCETEKDGQVDINLYLVGCLEMNNSLNYMKERN